MVKYLDVYLHKLLAGKLIQDESGQISFTYSEQYIGSPGAIALSHSLPLRKEIFGLRECRGFFSGILPEGDVRGIIARNLGISPRNDFSMLEQIGGECAGAITFVTAGQKPDFDEYQYRQLSSIELYNILKELHKHPLLAGEEGIRLSLAGAQDKLAVHVENDIISLPLGNSPSTHIIKPGIQKFEGMVFNEALCMSLATIIGLNTAKTEIGRSGDIDYLLIERYDRSINSANPRQYSRLHQEDFCQALGIVSEQKYQREGGPSLKDCFKLLREISSLPLINLQRLLDYMIFNYLIGNCDAHGKNFSLLYETNVQGEINIRLAPVYDLVCTEYYPELDKHLAMAIGDKYISSEILPSHFDKLAEEAGLSKRFVRQRIKEMAILIIRNINKAVADHPVSKEISTLIIKRVKHVLDKFEN